jgi:hypothetical protein
MQQRYVYPARCIDYRCEDRHNFGKLRDYIGAVRYLFTSSFRKPPSSHPKKRTVQTRNALENYRNVEKNAYALARI